MGIDNARIALCYSVWLIKGWKKACQDSAELRKGLNVVAKWFTKVLPMHSICLSLT